MRFRVLTPFRRGREAGLKRDSHIDLLPESVQKRKGFRKLLIRLAAAQAAIFLCIVAAIIGVGELERRTWDISDDLSFRVHVLRHGPEVAAVAYARDISARLAAEDAFVAAHGPREFDPVWITAIMYASDGHVVNLDYTGGGILISGRHENMTAIEAHRQSILDTGVFGGVELGRIILQYDGRYLFELQVLLGE